ncbi:hypothetical protein, conserved [Eimeria praecox]|uniref:Ankyrin repeat-containing protein n=1 Tax=Eimeria praecox TaxID=51316 RepID=U6G0I9_9EIME|nr:hypothetical protein, conserved [Eimeria praecox]
MAGPDPKRMYIAINSQNLDALKPEKPYWSKPFVFVNPSGTGTKYTSLQAAMILQKMKVVDFLLDQPSVDLTVKSTDGKNTVMIAVEAKMGVGTLEKILHKLDLRCLSEVDSSGKGPIDYAEPGTDVYEFLHSMGCKTRHEKEVAMAGFFGESVKGTVPGVSEHQRRRKVGNSPRKKAEKKTSSSGTSHSSSEEELKSPQPSEAPCSSEEEDDTLWRHFDDIDALEQALRAYIDEWGKDHDDGKSCAHWLRSVARARETGKTEKLLTKWNATIQGLNTSNGDEHEDETVDSVTKNARKKATRGRSTERASSAASGNVGSGHPRGRRTSSATVDPEAVKLFFSGKAGDQVNLRNTGKHTHRLTFVVASRSASVAPSEKRTDGEDK